VADRTVDTAVHAASTHTTEAAVSPLGVVTGWAAHRGVCQSRPDDRVRLATGAHEVIAKAGARPRWLSDGRRLVYTDDGALQLIDTRTKTSREIYRSPAGTIVNPAVSHDDRLIYYILNRAEDDIFLATLK
jgi:hypothetical protein